MSRRPPLAALPLVAAVLPALLTGCSGPRGETGPVDVPPATLRPAAVQACARLVAALPRELEKDVVRRPVRPASRSTAAWGDPAIVLRCGVRAGSSKDQPFSTDGVRWAIHDVGTGQRWTTTGRAVNLALVIPDRYDRQAELVIGLAPVIARSLT